MALRCIGYFKDIASGRTLPPGIAQFNLNVGFKGSGSSSDTGGNPDVDAVNTKLAANGLLPSGATFVFTSYANIDKQHLNGSVL